jgi:hypothetical protein
MTSQATQRPREQQLQGQAANTTPNRRLIPSAALAPLAWDSAAREAYPTRTRRVPADQAQLALDGLLPEIALTVTVSLVGRLLVLVQMSRVRQAGTLAITKPSQNWVIPG